MDSDSDSDSGQMDSDSHLMDSDSGLMDSDSGLMDSDSDSDSGLVDSDSLPDSRVRTHSNTDLKKFWCLGLLVTLASLFLQTVNRTYTACVST